ncbi:AraC-type DNA-binding protein [Chitinophaga jiangningensis]|uniref:AraC-type DNA-binding protein n=1 Tax=Chitinophaga jiangningensis TaxID=1419482 RepID=A0A1M7MG18_9BACT|nr:helix-turn-helix domain-containing protein [Chitinophaga jiangningensis]SHM89325.1 AraC-type DNA-binding protein [Chitinophaga jiangningensis]
MQILPSPAVRHCIRHYLFIKPGEASHCRLFADGNPAIVFSDALLINQHQQLSGSFLYGQISAFQDLYCQQAAGIMVVVLQPTGLQQLFRLPAIHVQQLILPLHDVLPNSRQLDEQIFHTTTCQEKIIAFENFIRQQINPEIEQTITRLVQFITQAQGQVSLQQLTYLTGWNERKLERHFDAKIGLSPKKFCDILKLQSFIRQIKHNNSLTAASYEAGYSDQPHLIKTFKKYTGLTPSQYLAASRLAVNFIALDK